MPRAAGFVNGVLRSVGRGGEPAFPGGAEGDALRLGTPRWIFERLSGFWDPTEAVAFLEASNREAAIGLRERPGGRAPGEPFPGIEGSYLSSDAVAVGEAVASAEAAVADDPSQAEAAGAAPEAAGSEEDWLGKADKQWFKIDVDKNQEPVDAGPEEVSVRETDDLVVGEHVDSEGQKDTVPGSPEQQDASDNEDDPIYDLFDLGAVEYVEETMTQG